MRPQGDLFPAGSNPCDVKSATKCRTDSGMLCRCKSREAGHAGAHICVDCGSQIWQGSSPKELETPPFARPPAHAHSPTSQIAAESVIPTAGTMRRRVLDFAREMGGDGVIRDDVVAKLGMLTQTVCARLNELERAGYLKLTGGHRPSATGRPAQVYVAT